MSQCNATFAAGEHKSSTENLILGLLLLPVLAWRGFVISRIWNWTMVPIFAWAALSTWQGLALSLMYLVLRGHPRRERSTLVQDLAFLFGSFLADCVLLLIAWLISGRL